MYTQENFNKVRDMIDERRNNSRREAELRAFELRSKSREIDIIDEELAKTGPLIFKVACAGGDIKEVKARNQALIARRREIVKSLGYPEDYSDVKYACPTCRDSGFLENTRLCTCFKSLLVTENIKSSGMGRLIERQSFENFNLDAYAGDREVYLKMQRTLEEAKRYAYEFPKHKDENLILIGTTGTGKTHISTAIAKVIIEMGYDVLYESAQNIISAFENDKFRSSWSDKENSADKYLECDLLIVDDLGTEFSTQFATSCIYNLINTRANKGVATIISTNLSASDIVAKYDERIASRIIGGAGKVLSFGGKDYRIYRGNS